MPYPISTRPPRPGDGSGICGPPDHAPEEPDRGERHDPVEVAQMLEAKRRRNAYRKFRSMFGP